MIELTIPEDRLGDIEAPGSAPQTVPSTATGSETVDRRPHPIPRPLPRAASVVLGGDPSMGLPYMVFLVSVFSDGPRAAQTLPAMLRTIGRLIPHGERVSERGLAKAEGPEFGTVSSKSGDTGMLAP